MSSVRSEPPKSPTTPTTPSSVNNPTAPPKDSLKDYKIVKNIGEGAFGEVYLARSRATDQLFAIKSISKAFLMKQKKEHHIFQERLILQTLSFPFLVKLFKTFQDESKIYFVLENIPNGELSKYLRKKKQLPYIEAMFITAEVVQILEGLHSRGIVHRDLKPENLMLDDNFHLKIIDFGTADVHLKDGVNNALHAEYLRIREKHAPKYETEVSSHRRETQADGDDSDEDEAGNARYNSFMTEYKDNMQHRKSFVGTVFYVAPEMLENQNVDCGCDYWALGIMLHRMLTGKYLFEEANDYLTFEAIKKGDFRLSKEIPEHARDLIMRLLKRDSAERLGNGKPGSDNDFQHLKDHPFFSEIDWGLLRESKSPLHLEGTEFEEDMDYGDSDLDEEKMLYGPNSQVEKKLILSGLVKKNKRFFLYNTRQLLFYSNGTFEYFDPQKNVKKGGIALKKDAVLEVKAEFKFTVNNGVRLYHFTSIDIPASLWVEKVKQTLSFM